VEQVVNVESNAATDVEHTENIASKAENKPESAQIIQSEAMNFVEQIENIDQMLRINPNKGSALHQQRRIL
jgi:hypothetical protein